MNHILAVDEFMVLLVNSIEKLALVHREVSDKVFLENYLVAIGDFAENYEFVVKDEIYSF